MSQRIEGTLNARDKRLVIVAGRWNEVVVKMLVEGAQRAIRQHGGEEAPVVWVAGSWEIPVAAHHAIRSGAEAVICLGCILQGETLHAQQLSNNVASALAELALRTGVPIGHGILTCETEEQALQRAGLKHGNKGEQAALAVLDLLSVTQKLPHELTAPVASVPETNPANFPEESP